MQYARFILLPLGAPPRAICVSQFWNQRVLEALPPLHGADRFLLLGSDDDVGGRDADTKLNFKVLRGSNIYSL